MSTKALPVLVLSSLVFGATPPIAAQDTSSRPSFDLLGSYTTGLADVAGETSAGETAALKYGRLYVTNALDVSLDIVNVLKPQEPRLFKRVYLNEYGSKVNSVDVSFLNLVAVAVEGKDKKTDAGEIVLVTPCGTVLRVVEVGALPDMVTFTPDGKTLLVANEGEPDCYGAGCTDPQGTVSVITVLPWLPARPVKTVSFDRVALPDGVRIFGPGASPAQDLEPEYIRLSSDSATAYVMLQENNAIALHGAKIYAFVQSPLRNPVTLTNGALDLLKNIRIDEFDPATLAARQFLYVMSQPALIPATADTRADTRADKIGDAVALTGRGQCQAGGKGPASGSWWHGV